MIKICVYYELSEVNTCGHTENYSLAEGKCEGGMFCPGYKALSTNPVSEPVGLLADGEIQVEVVEFGITFVNDNGRAPTKKELLWHIAKAQHDKDQVEIDRLTKEITDLRVEMNHLRSEGL